MKETERKLQKVYQLDNTKFLNDTELLDLQSTLRLTKDSRRRDALLIELTLKTGGRESEMLALTSKDLDHSNRTVLIRGLKGSNDREIPLEDDLWLRLVEFTREPCGKLIFPITARRFRQIWCEFRPAPKKLHSLRHTFAIQLYKRSRDLRLVQVALGHRNIANTMVYAQYVYQTEELRRLLYA